MSFITRCPACGTAFKVVPDQLKISEGWVRCGHCQQVFDATLDLQPWWPGAEASEREAPPPSPSTGSVGSVATDVPAAPDPGAAALVPPRTQATVDPTVGVLPPTPDLSVSAAPAPSVWSTPPRAAPMAVPADTGVPTGEPQLNPPVDAQPGWAVPMPGPAPAPVVTPDGAHRPTPAFMRPPPVGGTRRARWLGWAVCAVLALALPGQWAVHERDAWAARWPAAEPWLNALCQPVGCRVAPWRQIDALVIDSTALKRRSWPGYAFEVNIQNRATAPVATPAVELSLTDANEQVLVRRVWRLTDDAGLPPTLVAGAERRVTLLFDWPEPEARTMAGYRATLFYP